MARFLSNFFARVASFSSLLPGDLSCRASSPFLSHGVTFCDHLQYMRRGKVSARAGARVPHTALQYTTAGMQDCKENVRAPV
ncbi:hypothetical protein TPADAL_0683a [Treponema pallidum subsp. pallidum DAL-1]|uniref:Secreted protein n=2 Tax=Treponema pallidum TaxID=160 RepID=A0AAU8SAG9_TREPL|nr:hypothetical protein TPESAMD_0683a [Treponema pallidum subsp. pertenue str. SamoaD]AEZ58878.1 hypothetical protein TPECDC2_0683a [Treponema pallidum subsp. pertenue str. CDC2]AEZ59946.1 hypothetical protein TPEGAU_0683a [Treponema pallidum subsp. pertenue str. Gauthier]AEZ61006.1 hypothetical protein TPADAL_0683a [Treponema pallidum subsp. pallidum DAL-1]AGK84330.1 hypothetical protein TPFB_0683a [Treponema pallidum str. Fribourg-Blanc]AJB40706.1 hypothetical protein TENDBA_0683a [Treponema